MKEPDQTEQARAVEQASLTRNQKLSLAGVLSLTFLTYASTFTFGWVYDDPPQIPQNPHLRWSELGYVFTHHLWAGTTGTEARFYRPLLSIWFLLNKTLFGLNPHWFHVTTVMAHAAATAAAFLVARAVLRRVDAALFAAAIFGLHPVQAEAASWISAVNDPLAALLCALSFLACRRARAVARGAGLWWGLAFAMFLLALLMKEVSAILPLIVLVDFLASRAGEGKPRPSGKMWAALLLSYGAAGVVWFALREHAVGAAVPASSGSSGWSATLLTAPKLLLFDLQRVLWPAGLSPHYDLQMVASPTAQFFAPLGLVALLVVALAITCRRSPSLRVACAWMLFPVLPTLLIHLLNQDDFVHDRYLYMSMIGVAMLAGAAYVAVQDKVAQARLIPVLAGLLVVSLGFAGAIQSQYWANDVSLFSRAAGIAPQNEWAHLNYGSALSERHRFSEAAPQFVRSYELKASWQAAEYAGYSYQQLGDLGQAEHWFQVASEANPGLATAWFGLAQVRLEQHRPEDAVALLEKALRLQPDAEGYHYALGTALEQASRPAEALEEYKTELRLHPYQRAAAEALARLEAQLSRPR